MYKGTFLRGKVLYITWNTMAADGSSIAPTVDGTITVYKSNSVTGTTAGVTDTRNFNSIDGVHMLTIDTSADDFYNENTDYHIILTGAEIDGISGINNTVGYFTITT